MKKEVWWYGLSMGVLLLVLQALHFQAFIRDLRIELFGLLVAVIFLILGIWVGITVYTKQINWTITRKKERISNREFEVLLLMAKGHSNQEIADLLFVSLNTVKTHILQYLPETEGEAKNAGHPKSNGTGINQLLRKYGLAKITLLGEAVLQSISLLGPKKMKNANPCPVVHFEIGCPDLNITGNFYQAVFGWQTLPTDNNLSVTTRMKEGIPGSITSLGHEPHQYVMVYIQVTDIKQKIREIESHGGSVIVGPLPTGEGRLFAWLKDPAGNTIGISAHD